MLRFTKFAGLICILSVLCSTSALASDGVLEISHVCAVNTGCFSGDAEGYPITIDGSAGVSYRLTSNLVVPDIETDGIQVIAPSISIDLNGFEIVGSGCEGATTNCTPEGGVGSGINVTENTWFGVSVRNGSIIGMGNMGVQGFGPQAVLKDLRVRWNAGDGILANTGSIVSGNTVYENGGAGIVANDGLTVSGNTVHRNEGSGITAQGGSSVQGNTVRNNSIGLELAETATYRENVITGNTVATVAGGFNMGSNFCDTNDTCP